MLTIALLGVIGLLLLVIWSQRRIRQPHLSVKSDASIAQLARSVAGLTQGTLIRGNAVELFENGAFFDELLEQIGRARSSVHVEEYLWDDGVVSRRMVDALTERTAAGVAVRSRSASHARAAPPARHP